MVSLAIRSSRTFRDVLFSFEAMLFVAESVVAPGMVLKKDREIEGGEKFLCGDKPEEGANAWWVL